MLAIVIPYYKINFFRETLESLAAQTNKDFKVYVGNDASQEDPKKIIEEFRECLFLSYVHFEKNLGSKALTKQWERCIGQVGDEEWVMVLGDDDILEENCVGEFYKNLTEINKYKINVVRFATREIDDDSKIISQLYEHPVLELAVDSYYKKMFRKSRSSLSEYIFRKKIYLEKGFKPFALAWGSDNMAWLDFSDSKPIFTINKAVVYFRLSRVNISRSNYKEDLKWKARNEFFLVFFQKFFFDYDKRQRMDFLRYYEGLSYKLQNFSFSTYRLLSWRYFRDLGLWESLKFTRRFFKNK